MGKLSAKDGLASYILCARSSSKSVQLFWLICLCCCGVVCDSRA